VPLLTDDLAQVPEVLFEQPAARDLPKGKALEQTAHAIAKINHLNKKKTDAFLEALLASRLDLAGLPVAMGDACRTRGERSRQFPLAASLIREILEDTQGGMGLRTEDIDDDDEMPAKKSPTVEPSKEEIKGAPVDKLPPLPAGGASDLPVEDEKAVVVTKIK